MLLLLFCLVLIGLGCATLRKAGSPTQHDAARVQVQQENSEFEEMGVAMPERLLSMWRQGCDAFDAYHAEFLESGTLTPSAKESLKTAAAQYGKLAGFTLGAEREFVLYGRLQDVYAPLARDAAYAAEAASWCVQRAIAPAGMNAYAAHEGSESTIWNAAISGAIMYYRRAGDGERARKTVELARQHPYAATKYERVEQTPLVYTPGLTARPFWPAADFAIARCLEAAYADDAVRAAIEAELDALIGRCSLQRVVSPALPLDPGSEAADSAQGGAWSELALYDGLEWDAESAALVPTLVGVLQGDDEAAADICSAPTDGTPNCCGTSVVVSLLRLRPGATIQPHCGTTNRRLTMQFALRGSAGVVFTVGGEARGYGGDGQALVFDDSFEHHVHHGGAADRYVLYVVLKHPDLRPPKPLLRPKTGSDFESME